MAVFKRYDEVLEEWVPVVTGAPGPQGPQGDPTDIAILLALSSEPPSYLVGK